MSKDSFLILLTLLVAVLMSSLVGSGSRAGDRLAGALAGTSGSAHAATRAIRVAGTELQVTRADGSVLTAPNLVGAVISFSDGRGGSVPLRIDAVQPDPMDPAGGVLLYRFLKRDAVSSAWRTFCPATHDGFAVGFPLSGRWAPDGSFRPSEDEISLICADSAVGKCLRLGYRPWETAADGTPLQPYHQTCTRLIRADYCGDGTSHTRDGTPIRILNRLDLRGRTEPSEDAVFEGLWGPEGAICLRQPRLAGRDVPEDILAACPRLRGKLGKACRAENLMSTPGALLGSYGASPTSSH